MREILFRGKREDNGAWIEGYLVRRGQSAIQVGERSSPWAINRPPKDPDDSGEVCFVDGNTVGQFTGLTDKNGTRIFEGDIILFEDESPSNYEYHDCTEMRCGEIKFADGEFYLTNRIAVEMGDLIYDGKLDGVIVGNIHDNPELLEVTP